MFCKLKSCKKMIAPSHLCEYKNMTNGLARAAIVNRAKKITTDAERTYLL